MNEADNLMSDNNMSKPTDKEAYAKAQQEKRDKCYAMIDESAVEVVKSADTFRKYLDVQSRFDKLSANNNLLVFKQKPDATVMKTYTEWAEEKKQVKKGAVAVMILEPKEGKNANGEPHTYFNPKSKFDASDLTEQPELQSVTYDGRLLVHALVDNCPVKIVTPQEYPKDRQDGAYYDAKNNCIMAKRGMSPSEIFTSVSVAMAHAEMAQFEKQNATPENPATEYQTHKHEFQARCAAYVLAVKYGVPTDKVAIQSIPQRYNEYKAEDVKRELSQINRSVKSITERMREKLEPEKTQYKKRDDRDER